MSRRLELCLVLIVILANAGATCLYSGSGPDAQTPGTLPVPWNPVLEFLARLFTMPIPTAGIVDVRDVMLVFSLGLALLVVAAGRGAAARGSALPCGSRLNGVGSGPASCGENAASELNPARRWLWLTACGVAILALISALVNGSLDLSWGWIVRFITGAGWALLLARFLPTRLYETILLLLLGLAAAAMALTIWHRAERGLAHFTWPVGPVTTIGALAAMWSAMGAGHAAISILRRRFGIPMMITSLVSVLAAYVLLETERRAPALGWASSLAATGALILWLRWRGRIAVIVTTAALLICITGATTAYVISQARSPQRDRAASVVFRLEYWRLSVELIAQRPFLGWGPDTFVAHMTNKVAPLRAYSPHVYHGNIDPYAHNEWLQAAVELGVPGAAAYLALPVGAMVIAFRRLLATSLESRSLTRAASESAVTASLVAGLAAILVLDAGSITLRTPIMPVWYWTLLGLLCGRIGPTTQDQQGRSVPARQTGPLGTVAAIAGAIACFAVTWLDLSHAVAETKPIVRRRGFQTIRLLGEKTILARDHNAVLAAEAAHLAPTADRIDLAKDLWGRLYDLIPGSQDIPARYADALILAGQTEEARRVLEHGLSEQLNPFNVAANVLYARFITSDPVVRLGCVQRSLRFGPLGDSPQTILDEIIGQPSAMEALQRDLPRARAIAAGELGEFAADATVELLRINAYVLEQSGDLAESVVDQRLAADFYRRLQQSRHRYRRRGEAETDAFFQLARLRYAADRANYQEAFDAIVLAEKCAVEGIKHEHVARPMPEHGLVGGEIIPMEFPQRLRPMWQLSALLHVVAGHEQHLIERALSGLPPEQWTDADIRKELARIYRQAYDDLRQLPPDDRPAHYAHIRDMAAQSSATGRP